MTRTVKQLKGDSTDAFAFLRLEATLMLLETYPQDMRFSILSDLGSAIHSACERLADLQKKVPEDEEDDLEPPIYEQIDQIETLLGLSFVAVQAYITAIISSVLRIHQHYSEYFKEDLLGFDGKHKKALKSKVLSKNTSLIVDTDVPAMTAIDAFANYYKHHDEWGRDWNKAAKANKLSNETINLVRKLGADSTSNLNLQNAFEKIAGHRRFEDMSRLTTIAEDWRSALASEYRRELKRKRDSQRKRSISRGVR